MFESKSLTKSVDDAVLVNNNMKSHSQPTKLPTPIEALSTPIWARAVTIGTWVSLVVYMIYTQRSLNFSLFCGRIYQLVILPLITLREGGIHLTSVEYNLQSRAILAIVAYSLALYVLSLATNPFRAFMNGESKEFVAIAFVSGFKSVEKLFVRTYCNPNHWNSQIDQIEDGLSLPVLFWLMLILQYGQVKSSYTTMLCSYFLYKWIRSVYEYQTVSQMTSETVPTQTRITVTQAKSVTTAESIIGEKDVWRIYGNTYDLTDYIADHPGGKEAIMLGANREDCTALFQSYHAFSIGKAKAILEKYRVSDISDSDNSAEDNKRLSARHENDLFYDELCRRVAKALREAGVDPVKDRTGSWSRWSFYAFLFISCCISCYYHCKGFILGGFILGGLGTLMAGSIGHDGGHFSASRNPLINDICVWGTCMINNPIIWQHQHTYAHHSFTNEDERDPDLHHLHPFFRVSKATPFRPGYQYQAYKVYVLFMFMLTSVGLCYWYALRFMFERSSYGVVEWSDRKRVLRSLGVWFHIVTYSFIITMVPFFVHKSSWMAVAAALTPMMTCGFLFAMVSQVGHLTEATVLRDMNEVQKRRHPIAKDSWAAEQIETTNDFCPQSTFHFYAGGSLGLQIEHHLFPSLNHEHLTIIQPIVQQTSKEFNVQYNVYDSYTSVFNALLQLLTTLSVDELVVSKQS